MGDNEYNYNGNTDRNLISVADSMITEQGLHSRPSHQCFAATRMPSVSRTVSMATQCAASLHFHQRMKDLTPQLVLILLLCLLHLILGLCNWLDDGIEQRILLNLIAG